MNGIEYSTLIANYIRANFSERGIAIYKEVSLGKTVIGKNRRIDVFLVHSNSNTAFAIECKYQAVHGTVDEKIPYALEDIAQLPIDGCVAYAGKGFSAGVLHLLEASPLASYCLPESDYKRTFHTRELDQLLAMKFSWWDLIVEGKAQHLS